MRLKSLVVTAMLLAVAAAANAQSLVGTWRLVKESDGSAPKARAVVNLTLSADGRLTLKAVQPGEVFEDSGTWSTSGDRITMRFKEMEKSCTAQRYVLSGASLTLPIRILNDGPGTSTWTSAASQSTPAAGSLAEILRRTLEESKAKNNQKSRATLDRLASLGAPDVRGGLAESYYVQASIFFMKSYYDEAWYGFAMAAELQPLNGVYLNNLAMVLMELDRYADALAILQQVTAWFPNLDPPWGNLAVAFRKTGDLAKAETAVKQAMAISPNTGLYQYLYGKILKENGRAQEAKKYFDIAWQLGYAGSGREGEPGSSEPGGTGSGSATTASGSGGRSPGAPPPPGAPASRPGAAQPGAKPGSASRPQGGVFPPEWVGHYEARYVRARSGENAKEASTAFGQGLTGTNVNLQTLACAKEFSMDISSTGSVTGRGRIMYVYQGKALNPMMGLMPTVGTVGMGGFAVNLKDGYQIRDWTFSGTVDPQGRAEIQGIPQQELDLLNVGQWQKIKTWSPLPPDAAGAAMRGPFHMTLATGKESGPHIRVDQWLNLGDKLIRRVHYEAFIVKSSQAITPDCKYEKPAEAKCPASEYIKTKVSLSPHEGVTVEASTTFTKGQGGVEQQGETTTKVGTDAVNVDTSGKFSVEGSKGMFTGSAEFNPTDGSYAVSVGVGVDTSQVLKDAPASISQKIELVYDSKCGWGIKGTMSGKAGKFGAGVEGAVFFNKGV